MNFGAEIDGLSLKPIEVKEAMAESKYLICDFSTLLPYSHTKVLHISTYLLIFPCTCKSTVLSNVGAYCMQSRAINRATDCQLFNFEEL